MSKQLHSTVVAREFLDLSQDGLSQQQLQKLVYFAHGLYMIDDERDGLVFDRVEAWTYGPIFRDLWNKTKYYGSAIITRLNLGLAARPDTKQMEFIQEVFDAFGDLSGIQLSSMTHQADSPWDKTYTIWGEKRGVIPNGLIRDHFVNISKRLE